MQSKAQIDQVLRQKSDAVEIPGVVAVAASGSEVIYQGAFGKRDLSKPDAMTTDSVFWIASMTKASRRQPRCSSSNKASSRSTRRSANCCPTSPHRKCWKDSMPRASRSYGPPKSPITLRQLMTHTAGFCYDLWNGDMATFLAKTGTPGVITCQNAALKTPIASDPGTRWEYGTNIDFVGKAVEAASGKKLDAYLRDHLFAPLGMNDTAFKITDAMRKRLVAAHARGANGKLETFPFELEQNPEFHMGGGGLYGTAGDYIKFTQMILNKGRGNGNQVLKR